MISDDERVPIEDCMLPGTVTVTPRALEYGKQFQASIPPGYIVAFDWFDGGRIKSGKDAPWIEVGPSLGLGAFRTGQIPEKAIDHDASFKYAVLIREKMVRDHPQKIIDLDDLGHLIFR